MNDEGAPQRQGCPGQYMRLSGATAAICYGCARYGEPGPQIEPRAAIEPLSRAWACPDRIVLFAGA